MISVLFGFAINLLTRNDSMLVGAKIAPVVASSL